MMKLLGGQQELLTYSQPLACPRGDCEQKSWLLSYPPVWFTAAWLWLNHSAPKLVFENRREDGECVAAGFSSLHLLKLYSFASADPDSA